MILNQTLLLHFNKEEIQKIRLIAEEVEKQVQDQLLALAPLQRPSGLYAPAAKISIDLELPDESIALILGNTNVVATYLRRILSPHQRDWQTVDIKITSHENTVNFYIEFTLWGGV